MKIATWNVNSLRVRLPHVIDWLKEHEPDILGLQETKLPDHDFPADAFSTWVTTAVLAARKLTTA